MEPVSLSYRLTDVSAQIDAVLETVLPDLQGPQSVVIEAMRYAALGGGKRLRPFLLIETARMLGTETRDVWQVAAALECVHVYSLVHDDLPCMDDDDMRRGKPTVHKAYGEAMAVLAGDALLTQAFDILAHADIQAAPEIRMKLFAELAKAAGVSGMIGGQVMDITIAEDARDEALITQLQALKTGALIEYAVKAGGLLAKADALQMVALQSYAKALGLAFQITDDLLDVEGDSQIVGKAVGKDEGHGKVTFVTLLGLEGAKDKAAHLGAEAKRHLECFGEAAHILGQVVDFTLERTH